MGAFIHAGMAIDVPDPAPHIFRPQARVILQVILDGFGDSVRDSEIQVIPVIPKNVTVHVNSYKQADSFEIVLAAVDLPFDPQLIRAGAAEIFLFETAGGEEQRVLDRRHPLVSPDPGGVRQRDPGDTLALELGTDASRDQFTLANKPRIVGTFDDDDMELSESGKWVTIKGQDYTSFLLSIQFPPDSNGHARRIPVGKRLDVIVDELLEEADPDRQLSVAVRGLDVASLPIVSGGVATNKRGITIEQGTSYWDVIYKLVERHGFICFVDGLDVVISRPKTITDKDVTTIRRMVWGRNIEHLKLRRHLGKEQAPTIVVKSYVPGKGTLSVEFPDGQLDKSGVFVAKGKHGKFAFKRRIKEKTTISKKGKVKTTVRERDEYQIVVVHGVSDPAALRRIAENRYHLLGKAERTVVLKTRDLKDLHGTNLLDISAGDALTIDWDEFNSELMTSDVAPAIKVRALESKGYQTSVAETVVKHFSILQGLQRPLRFKEGTIEYDADSGVSIEMELQDFIVQDGVRPDSGAVRSPTLASRRESMRHHDGTPVGWTPAKQAAQVKRFDKP